MNLNNTSVNSSQPGFQNYDIYNNRNINTNVNPPVSTDSSYTLLSDPVPQTNIIQQNTNVNNNYPQNNVQNLNQVNMGGNDVNNPKYFGFWGPELKKNY